MAKLRQKPATYLERDKYKTRAETMQALLSTWPLAPESERVLLADAADRIAAETVYAVNTLPVERAAGADGVAVRFKDFANGVPDFSNWVEGVDYAPADMGDDFDDAFDTVIWVEEFTFADDGKILDIVPEDPVEAGQLVRERGSMLRAGEVVLKAGERITPFRLGLLGSAGIESVQVVRRPRIAFIPSGSELVTLGVAPARGQNVESNHLMVEAFGKAWGAEVITLPIVADQQTALAASLDLALATADIVLLNGGTSMGTEDYSSSLLIQRASHYQHGVRSIPGIPVAVAIVDEKPVVNLPGPPYAAFCALDWCVRGLVCAWYGEPMPKRATVEATLRAPIEKPPIHEMFVRLHLSADENGEVSATPLPRNGRTAELTSLWNGLFVAPIGQASWHEGETIVVECLT